jgi:hypothetical protein
VQRDALGMKDIVPAVIEHPLSSLTEVEIKARAAAALPQVVEVWRGTLKDPD